MYRISKVLNHNTIIGIQEEDHQEYLIMAKGIGFGKKVTERVELPDVFAEGDDQAWQCQ